MKASFRNLSPEDRKVYMKWVRGLFAFYAAVLVAITGAIVSNPSSQSLARHQTASLQTTAPASPATNRLLSKH